MAAALLVLLATPSVRVLGRRAVLSTATAVISTAAVCCIVSPAHASTAADLLGKGNAERCVNGEGEACDRLAEGNEYVRMLQERSRLNKQKNADRVEALTVMQLSYDEYFATLDKNMVLQPNGKYAVLSTEEYARLRKAGQIRPGGVDRLLVDLDAARAAAPVAAPGAAVYPQE
jgi:hypothetical protein